jgi:pyruvate carboxylase
MRVVTREEDVDDAFERCTSEALSGFGNGACFVERYLAAPRHIEVQIFGDAEGNVIHFYDRDCSVQRRHQKVIEIAPSQELPDEVRAAILRDAVKITSVMRFMTFVF